jgi:hypothetical protein
MDNSLMDESAEEMPITGLTIVGTGPHIGACQSTVPKLEGAFVFCEQAEITGAVGMELQRLAGSGWIPIWDNPWKLRRRACCGQDGTASWWWN